MRSFSEASRVLTREAMFFSSLRFERQVHDAWHGMCNTTDGLIDWLIGRVLLYLRIEEPETLQRGFIWFDRRGDVR